MGTIKRDNVAENFIKGPIISKEGSNGIKPNVPITQHSIPDFTPNTRKHITHIIDTGSIIAIPHPGILGRIFVVKTETTNDKAPNKAAPDICKTNWDDFDM